jgi:hypothetical protein
LTRSEEAISLDNLRQVDDEGRGRRTKDDCDMPIELLSLGGEESRGSKTDISTDVGDCCRSLEAVELKDED